MENLNKIQIVNILSDKIKSKKELKNLNDDYINHLVLKKLNSLSNKQLSSMTSEKDLLKKSFTKNIIKEVRGHLRDVYGVFISERYYIKEKLKVNSSDDDFLKLHKSTIERLDSYEEVYEKIFTHLFEKGLSKNYTILDLACGMNPLSIKLMPITPKIYYGCDLSMHDMDFISSCFKEWNYNGKLFSVDLTHENAFNILEENVSFPVDVCFLFKALDSLEAVQRHISKKLISFIDSKYFVVSFATKTIGGKTSINSSKRAWFVNFIEANNWNYSFFETSNEIYFIIHKKI